jgi:glycosyltransferase involved in cell wall biosynthesis
MPLHKAGTEIYTHTLAKSQQASGHKVAVITPHIEFYRTGEMNQQYQYDGVDVFQFLETANPKNRDIFSGKKKPEGLKNFLNILEQLQPDIVHFHELNRSIGLTIEHVKIAKQFGAKVYVTMHLSFYTCNTNLLIKNNKLCNGKINTILCTSCTYNNLYSIPRSLSHPLTLLSYFLTQTGVSNKINNGKFKTMISMPSAIRRIKSDLIALAEMADQLICLTEWYKKILLLNEVPERKISVITQAFTGSKGLSVIQTKNSKINLPIRIIFLGRIQSQKGVHILIEACKSFSTEELIVDIYGKQENTDYYNNCIKQSAGVKHINWKGSIERSEVLQTISNYDILCLPSIFSEMSPLVIQEAFMAGIPVMASRVYGNIELIKNGENGLLFDFNSIQSLKDQIKLLINDPELIYQMKKNIMPPQFFNVVADKYSKIYQTY